MQKKIALCKITLSMTIFGTIGLFVSYIPLPSSLIAFVRAIGGFLFLVLCMLIKKEKPSFSAIRRNLLPLCIAGLLLGFNWILLFESYKYISVAVSTLCYYMAPIIVVCVSPVILKERLNVHKIVSVIISFFGMLFISGVIPGGVSGIHDIRGVLLALSSAVLYASIVLANKQLKNISALDRTIFQLGFSSIVMLPYCLITSDLSGAHLNFTQWIVLIIVALVHTGLAYFLYFGSMEHLSGQTVAMISYIDPVIAVLCSLLIMQQPAKLLDIPGAVLIITAAILSEIPLRKRERL